MRLHFLGGTDEVGASCLLLEAGGLRILVDAGVRVGGGRRGDPLPDLARASELGGLDAILVTHAHLDHSGALPLVHGAFPRAQVLMTEPTLELLRILLLDALKVMSDRAGREDELPLYPLPAVEALLARSRGVRFQEPIPLDPAGTVRAVFFPAGHVLGAAAVGIEAPEGRVLFTGDCSLTDQRTVPGMAIPRFSPDLLVCESTYGARLHASRRAEEERLAQTVLGVLREGGKVLVPAFALGRAQEVLLILRRALAQEGAPPGTVWADGMVRAVCGTYTAHTDYLTPALRGRAGEGRGLFFTADGRIRPVTGGPTEREAILAGGPCVIVASSGMLAGGPSAFYAGRLAAEPSALIAITGYQDEEAPGRVLQQAASGEVGELTLGGAAVPIRCRVATYGLSAHADAQELAGLGAALRPRRVALVHGDDEARAGLGRLLADQGQCGEVHLPRIGDCLEVTGTGSRRSAAAARPHRPLGEGRPLDAMALPELRRRLLARDDRPRLYSAAELAEIWSGPAGVPDDLAPLHALLRQTGSGFVPDSRRPFLYRVADAAAGHDPGAASVAPTPTPAQTGTPPPAAPRDAAGRLEQNAALALAQSMLGPASGLYRVGVVRERWTLLVFFRFPDVARNRHAAELAELAARSGWAVEVHPEAHLASLGTLVDELLGPDGPACRPPSIRTEVRRVAVALACLPSEQRRSEVAAAFLEQTGFSLEFEVARARGTPAARQTFDASGKMEINLAFAEVERAFVGQPHRPLRRSKKNDHEGPLIELSFVSPEVGARYAAMIEELEQATKWRVRIAASVDQQTVLATMRSLLPPTWRLTRDPGLDVAGRKVRLRLSEPPPAAEWAAVEASLREATGFGLA